MLTQIEDAVRRRWATGMRGEKLGDKVKNDEAMSSYAGPRTSRPAATKPTASRTRPSSLRRSSTAYTAGPSASRRTAASCSAAAYHECERRAAFFLPYYLDAEDFDVSEYIRAIKVTAGFGMPGHRDYMGAALGLGVKREWLVGDIWVIESEAFIFCMPSVEEHLLLNLDKVGRFGVKTGKIALADVPVPERKVIKVAFTVMSMRLDAVATGMFSVSRTEAARLVEEGRVSLNYASACAPTRA